MAENRRKRLIKYNVSRVIKSEILKENIMQCLANDSSLTLG